MTDLHGIVEGLREKAEDLDAGYGPEKVQPWVCLSAALAAVRDAALWAHEQACAFCGKQVSKVKKRRCGKYTDILAALAEEKP